MDREYSCPQQQMQLWGGGWICLLSLCKHQSQLFSWACYKSLEDVGSRWHLSFEKKPNSFLGSNSFSLELEKVVGLEVFWVAGRMKPYRITSLWLLLCLYWKKQLELLFISSSDEYWRVTASSHSRMQSQWGSVGPVGGMGEGGHGFQELWEALAPPSLAASTMG